MKTFEEFWERCLEDEMFYNIDRSAALIAWEAATLAERERCVGVCRRFRLDLAHDKAADIVEELTDAVRNPSE